VLRDIQDKKELIESTEGLSRKERHEVTLDYTQEKLQEYRDGNFDLLSPQDLEIRLSQFNQWLTDYFDGQDLHYKHPFYEEDNEHRDECPESEDEQLPLAGAEVESRKRIREDSPAEESPSKKPQSENQGSLLDDYADTSGEMPSYTDED